MKKVLSLLTALLICFGVSACGTKNENKGPKEEKIVEYRYISGKKESIGHNNEYIYTFQVDVTNNTDEEIYILPREIYVNAWREWIIASTNKVGNVSAYEDPEFKVYLDQTNLLEVSISYALAAGLKQSIYIVTTRLSANLGSITYNGVEYSKRELKHFTLSVGNQSIKEIAVVNADTLLAK